MLARSRTFLACLGLIGFTLIVLLGACDDEDDSSDADDATGDESDGGW
jgi:hypothetical protein